MSFEGQVLWKRKLIGPDWAIAAGAAMVAVAAAAAPPRNLRRLATLDFKKSLDMWTFLPWARFWRVPLVKNAFQPPGIPGCESPTLAHFGGIPQVSSCRTAI